MPGPSASIQIIGNDRGVQRMLEIVDTALNPVAVAGFLGAEVGPYLHARAKNRFQQEGDDVTGAWAPLAPATESIRASMGYGPAHPINVREGDLERYITETPDDVNVSVLGATLTMPGVTASGDMVDKVQTAQGGSTFGRTGTPARPVLGLNERDLAFVLEALALHIQSVGKTKGARAIP